MSQVLEYAKTELEKYLKQITNSTENININLMVDKNIIDINNDKEIDPQWDDAFKIEINNCIGNIVGVNERSVLLGVYDFLNKLGCCFLMPTEKGEYIPTLSCAKIKANYIKRCSNRHRGICIEGAVSLENVIDIIEWAPKLGFNSYFIQFRDGHTFFERWYTHEGNDYLEKQEYNRQDSVKNVEIIINEIKKRGMLYHAVGHGWTCESLGFPSTGWHKFDDNQIPDNKREYLALLNNKRSFYEGIPLNTQLCYSNEKVKDLIITEIINYISAHKEVDFLHFWLADNFNNFCECEECKKLSPPDQYIAMLNELDQRLTQLNLKTKIVFLIYFELLWTPEKLRMINQDRFIMMFAPITRTFTKTFLINGNPPDKEKVKRIPFKLNEVEYPKDIESNIAFLYEWQKIFKGDSFDFDYHMMWDIYREFSNIRLAKVIYDDIKGLEKIGLNGLMSCQVQRAFFPTGICMYVMGKTLFDNTVLFNDIINEYFSAAYGEYSTLALDYLKGISEFFSHEYMRSEIPMINSEVVENYQNGYNFNAEYAVKIENALNKSTNAVQKSMLEYLKISCSIYSKLALILRDKAKGTDIEKLKTDSDALRNYVCSIEDTIQKVLDVYFFNLITKGTIESVW